jgi:uncharacterized membrane protein YfcA
VASSVRLWLMLSVGVSIGTLIGVPVLRHIPTPLYRRIVGALLLTLGLGLMAAATR